MLTLIGSHAMRFWFPDAREPGGDWDGDFREVRAVTRTVTVYE